MIEIRQHPDFAVWLRKLRDRQAQTRIAIRLVRMQSGLLGDVKYFGGIGEVRGHKSRAASDRPDLVVELL